MLPYNRSKAGLTLKIPGLGERRITTLVADYDGTLSCKGNVTNELKERLTRLADLLDVHILTADKKAKSNDCFGRLPLTLHILNDKNQDVQKRDYLATFNPAEVVGLGNGNNDRLFLQCVKANGGLCMAVLNGEGCSIEVLLNAHVFVHGPLEALDLLLDTSRLVATLRY